MPRGLNADVADTAGLIGGALKDGYDIAQEIQGGEAIAGEEPELLEVAKIYYDLGKLVYEHREELGRTFSSLAHSINELFGATYSYEVNGFKIVTTPTKGGEAFMVVGYDNINGFSNLVVRIPEFVKGTDPDTGLDTPPVPIVAILNIGSAERIDSLQIGSEVRIIAPHALDIGSLTNFIAGSASFNSVDGVLFSGDQTELIRFPRAMAADVYTVPATVTKIGNNAFFGCTNLRSLAIGPNVTQIGTNAFGKSSLQYVYFGGNAPLNDGTAFYTNSSCTVYYVTGTTGWGPTFGGIPATLYNPFSSTVINGAVRIDGFSGNGWHNPASPVVLIPNVIGGLPVTAIKDAAFNYNPASTGLTNLVIPDSVTSIGDNAFVMCIDLKKVTLSRNLTSLGEQAFLGCSNLTSLNIPNGVKTIPAALVEYCGNLKTLIIGTNVTSIGQAACGGCSSLFSLSLPATLATIGPGAFSFCGSLQVRVDPLNPYFCSDSGGSLLNKAQTELIHANARSSGSYTVPNTVINIDDSAFYGATLSTVLVPAGVLYLGPSAFASCSNLAAAYFAGNPPSADGTTFSGATNLVYRLPNAVGWQSTYAGRPVTLWLPFQLVTNNNSLTLTAYTGLGGNVDLRGNINGLPITAIQAGIFANPGSVSSLILPDTVTNIANGAFSGLINMTNLVIGNNVTNIGNNAFSGCSSLAYLVIPDSVRTIGSGAFAHCGITNVVFGSGLTELSDNLFDGSSLQSVTIPANILRIGDSTFANNPMQSAVIPASVTSLGSNAFANCKYLAHVYFQGDAPASDGTAFNGSYNEFFGPTGSVAYRSVSHYLPGATGFRTNYSGLPTEVLPISYTANNGTITITRFTGIGDLSIFSTLNGLPVTGIGDYAFANCPGLNSVTIPAGITNIGAGPFMNCTNLTSLVVAAGNPSYVTVSNVLFNSARTVLKQYPAGLGGVYQVPATVTNIGAGAFYGSGLKQVTIPASVTLIGSGAFNFCRALSSISVAGGNAGYISSGGILFNIGQTVLIQFPGALGGNYTIPASVTTLGPAAFAASGVRSVVIPASVSSIASNTLAYCSSLTNITVLSGSANFASVNGVLEDASRTVILQYPGGLIGPFTIGTNITVIGNSSFAGASLNSVTVPATVWNVGSSAFADCSFLRTANFFGNTPANDGTAFTNSSNVRALWLYGKSGWGNQYGGAPTREIPFSYRENGNNTLTVTGYDWTFKADFGGYLIVPDNIFGTTVTGIGDTAFGSSSFISQTNITSLYIPPTITSIGEFAFAAFDRVSSLYFRNTGSLSVGASAFAGCSFLKSLDFLGSGPVTIGNNAFEACGKLNHISFGGVTSIGNYAFYNSTALQFLSIGDSVTSIGAYAFSTSGQRSGLSQIDLPAGLTFLGSHAFANCGIPTVYATTVLVSGSPPVNDGTAFANSYARIFFRPGTGWGATYSGMATEVISSDFNSTSGSSGATITGLLSGYSTLIIPSTVFGPNGTRPTVRAIGNNAFAGNQTVTNVSFPASLLSVGDASFLNCSNLLSAALPDSVTSIGNSAFQNCVNLRGINISLNVTNIGANAFAGCRGETNLVFGAGLAYLGTNAFKGWTNLQTVYFNGDAPAGNGSAFVGDTNASVYVLPGTSGWGTTFSGRPVVQWVQYYYVLATNGLPAGQNSTSVLYGPDSPAPYNTNGATNVSVVIKGYTGSQSVVTVPSVINGWPVTSVSDITFTDRRDIGSVILPNSITDISGQAFKYCALTNIVLSTNLAHISPSAFYGCGLQSVVLPDSLTNLESSVFYLSALTNVVLPKHLLSIGDYAFSGCPLRSIVFPQSLQTIGTSAFDVQFNDGRGLTNVVLPSSLTSIGDRAFFRCPMVGALLIPPGVTYIGEEAFASSFNSLGPIYFEGNAPASDVFYPFTGPFQGVYSFGVVNGVQYATGPGLAYYDPTTFGWGTDYYGLKTVPWNPYTYVIVNNTINITGYLGSGGALKVPSTIGGIPVTAISANAFANNPGLIQVTLPTSITSLGAGAFAGSTNLTGVYFTGDKPAAGANVFAGDPGLAGHVYYLNTAAGWSSPIISGVTPIPYSPVGAITVRINPGPVGAQWQVDSNGAFYASGATATNLSVGSHKVNFSTVGGTWLTPPNITLFVSAWQESPFTISYDFVPFTYVTNGSGKLTITGFSGTNGTVYIPTTINGVTVSGIAANAFANSGISGIVLPDTITSVGTNVFAGCQNLVTASLGSGITNLSGNVFKNCPNLLSVFFDGNAPATDGTIFTGDANVTVYRLTAATGWTSPFSGRTVSVIPYTFSVLGDNTVRITGYSGPGGNLAIPGRIGGLPVTDIYASVFQNNLSLTNVTIPDSVLSIEFQAFAGCSNLQTVALGTNLQWIGPVAFINCTSLTNLDFPDSLQHIYQQAFQNNRKLASINLGQGLPSIEGPSVFESCTNLAKVTFGNSLTNIGPGAFAFCGALTNLTFPNGLVEIQAGAFGSCTNLTSVEFGTNLSIIGDGAFGNCNFRSLVFPPNIYLGSNAFFACRQLTSVLFTGMMQFISTPIVDTFYLDTLAVVYYPASAVGGLWRSPDRATSDYQAAVAYSVVSGPSEATVRIDHFAGGGNFIIPSTLAGHPVTSLASNALAAFVNNLAIPAGLVNIGIPFFATPGGDSGVSTITVDPGNPNYTVSGGVLFNKDQTTLIRCPNSLNSSGNYTVPSSVTSIADYAFSSCNMASVTLPPNLTTIGNGAFFGAGSLVSVSSAAPDNLTYLGQNAFDGCSALTNFVTGNNLSSVQSRTFANCTQLKSVSLGSAVGSIGAGAFSNCVNLASIPFPSGLGTIGDAAFANCQSLVSLALPPGVPAGTNYYSLQLGSGVFTGCNGLQSAYFLGNRPNPDYGNTFVGDSQLTVYYLTNSLGWSTTFGGAAAASYAPFGSLQVSFSPNLNGQAWRVDGGAWVSNVTAQPVVIQLPAGSHILSFATVNNFYTPSNQVLVVNNLGLTSFTAQYFQTPIYYTANANFVTVVGGQLNADGFLVIPPSINGLPVTGIADDAFANNQSLIGVIMPSTVTNIGANAFFRCTNLTDVIFSTNLLSIGQAAFYRCAALRAMVIPDSVTNLGSIAFANCAQLSSVQLGSGLRAVGFDAFASDPALATVFFNGAPPSDATYLTNIYPQITSIYYNPAAAGWGNITNGNPHDWTSLFIYRTNNTGGITIDGIPDQYSYSEIAIIPSRINGLPVTAIGDRAFQYRNEYVILLPPTVTSLGSNTFSSGALGHMFIGSTVTNIASTAFRENGNLYSLIVHPANPNYSDVNGILYNKAQTELIAAGYSWGGYNSGPIPLTVPNGVLRIDDFALSQMYHVSQINLPASLASIGEEALSGNYYLTNITVDPLNTSFIIANNALLNSNSTVLIQYFGPPEVTHYVVPSSVQVIASGAFFYKPLTSVLLPSSLVNVGADAFFGGGFESLLIPNSVTNIGRGAFTYSSLTNLVLPAGLTRVSANLCYNCQSLTSVFIPPGVTDIGDYAFAYSHLAQVLLPRELRHLGTGAFAGTYITTVVIPDQVTEISVEAFNSCRSLTSVTLGAAVTNIASDAFSYDQSLYTVNFDDNLVRVSTNAFYSCQSLGQVVFPAHLALLDLSAFQYAGLGSIYFLGDAPATNGPVFTYGTIYYNSDTSGWSGQFSGRNTVDYNAQFTYVTNADSTLTIVGCNLNYGNLRLPAQTGGRQVTGIASGAFLYQNFESLTIPPGITNIAPDAFAQSGMKRFVLSGSNPACVVLDGSLYNSALTRLLAPANATSFTLPATVTNLVLTTFDSCYNLTNILVNPGNPLFCSVDGALFNKQATVLLRYPSGATAGSYFVPESTLTIGTNAFAGGYLAAIRVPASVTNIQSYAMANSYGLRGVYFEGAAPSMDSTVFTNDGNAIVFYLPPASAASFVPAGLTVQPWLSLFTWVTNNGTSISIVSYNNPGNRNYVLFPKEGISGLPITDVGTAFAGLGGSPGGGGGLLAGPAGTGTRAAFTGLQLTGITLPDGITNLVAGAFSESGLGQVVLPASLSSIGSNAFSGCQLGDLTLPPGVAYIGDYAFAANSLMSLTLPAGMRVLGAGAFSDNDLPYLTLNDGLLSIGDEAFANNRLQHLIIPNSVTNIGVRAFRNNSLSTAVIGASVSRIGSEAFDRNSLETISLSDGLRNIENSAFSGNDIRTLVIPSGVTNIGSYAFAENSVSSLTLPGSLVSIGDSAFQYDSLSSLLIPASVTSIGDSAFAGNSIDSVYFLGNAPTNDNGTALSDNNPAIAYYLSGSTGWGTNFGSATTQMLPQLAFGATNGGNTLTLTTFIGAGSVVVPSTVGGVPVKVIGTAAFATSGPLINNITLPSGITTLSFEAFASCPVLRTIVIPDTLTNIDIDAFAGCPGLTNIIVSPNNPYFSSVNGVLFDKNQTTLLACGGGVTGVYVIPSTVTVIGADAFIGCAGLTNIVFPPGLTSVGDPAFAYCDNLTTLTIPATVTDLGDYCFAYCPRLTTVYFEGDAPPDNGTVFEGSVNATVYYRPSAVGFGSSFGSAPAQPLRAPVAAPITVYRDIGSAVQISLANLSGYWTDPNGAYPVTLQSVVSSSTNRAPVSNDLTSILYTNVNNVGDKIIYTLVDTHGMVGVGTVNIVPTRNGRPLTATNDSILRPGNGPIKVAVADLVTNDFAAVGTPTLLSVAPHSAQGSDVLLAGSWVYYTPAGNPASDSFTYVLTDGQGSFATGVVAVATLTPGNAPSKNITDISAGPSGLVLTFAGIPNYVYRVQYTTNLTAPILWMDIGSILIGSNGKASVTNAPPAGENRFFRTVYP